MTNEEMQKTMEFILEHQAQFEVNFQQLQEERLRDQPRLARLEESSLRLGESFQLVVQLLQIADSRNETLESINAARFDTLESSVIVEVE